MSTVPPPRKPADPEKGLRGVMSATLILEAITVLLAIPVAANTGGGVGAGGIAVICLLALLLIGTCAIIAKPYALQVILGAASGDDRLLVHHPLARRDGCGVRPGVGDHPLVPRRVPAAAGGRYAAWAAATERSGSMTQTQPNRPEPKGATALCPNELWS